MDRCLGGMWLADVVVLLLRLLLFGWRFFGYFLDVVGCFGLDVGFGFELGIWLGDEVHYGSANDVVAIAGHQNVIRSEPGIIDRLCARNVRRNEQADQNEQRHDTASRRRHQHRPIIGTGVEFVRSERNEHGVEGEHWQRGEDMSRRELALLSDTVGNEAKAGNTIVGISGEVGRERGEVGRLDR